MRQLAFRLVCLVVWCGFLAAWGTELARAAPPAFGVELHACRAGKCHDRILTKGPQQFVCESQVRVFERLTVPKGWTVSFRCVSIPGMPEA
ncbi:hypothetical protein [uncultured Methylobacterium sp.]|uniref:hypothetical protein n=1 Tax=uncultured Methylobacterium sp. TaxID=157278 RepID=UPI0035CC83B9